MTSKQVLEKLAAVRDGLSDLPCETVASLGEQLALSGWLAKDSSQADEVLEQVAIACVECARLELADACLKRLESRYPKSPRVVALRGMYFEAQGLPLKALEYYTLALEREPSAVRIRKRLIALHLSSATDDGNRLSLSKGVDMLVDYLDTYYDDGEAWLELADVYASVGQYTQSLTALSHAILLNPNDAFALLRHAETCYTIGNYVESAKEALRVVEMCDGVKDASGPSRRAALVAKQSIKRMEEKDDKWQEVDKRLGRMLVESQASQKDLLSKWVQA